MKCFSALALVGLMVALPACAQHAASHGGSSSHSGPVSHGSSGGSAPSRLSSAPRFSVAPRAGVYRGIAGRQPGFVMRSPSGAPNPFRPPYTGGNHYRRPYGGPWIGGAYYGVPGYPWVSPYFGAYDDIDTSDAADAQQAQAAYGADNGYAPDNGNDAADPGQYPQYPPYPNYAQAPPSPYSNRPEYQPKAAQSSAPAPTSEEAVTLIFKDGRPPETIHNYLLTAKTLYVGDDHRRAISVDALDLAATAKANQDAGVDFTIPSGTR